MNDQKPTNAKSRRLNLRLNWLALAVGLALVCWASVAAAGGDKGATVLRWDLIHLIGNVLSAGGIDSAAAADGSQITLTGSGTWLATSGRGEPQAVTGGGTWETFDAGGASTGSGMYSVTGLVAFDE